MAITITPGMQEALGDTDRLADYRMAAMIEVAQLFKEEESNPDGSLVFDGNYSATLRYIWLLENKLNGFSPLSRQNS